MGGSSDIGEAGRKGLLVGKSGWFRSFSRRTLHTLVNLCELCVCCMCVVCVCCVRVMMIFVTAPTMMSAARHKWGYIDGDGDGGGGVV